MPFRSISSRDEEAFVALGLSEEITNALARFRGMSIVSSYSLGRFAKDNRFDVSIRREFGLNFLLDGSVQRAGSKIRIIVQLLDLRANNQVAWTRRFDSEYDDVLSLQDEIAARVAAQLDSEILATEAKRSTSQEPGDTSAYHLMLRAFPLIGQMQEAPFMRAGQYLAGAIATEPEHAQSHTWYAYWHILLLEQGWAEKPCMIINKANELADRAIELDPFDARGLAVSGHIGAVLRRRLPEAMALHNRALSVNPSLAMAWALSGAAHAYAGDLNEAERRTSRYKTLSPHDPHAFFFDSFLVLVALMKRDYEVAVELGRAAVQLNPWFSATYKPYLSALGHTRRDHEAVAVRRRLLALEPHFTIENFLKDNPIECDRNKRHYADGLRLAGVHTTLSSRIHRHPSE